MTSGPGTPGTPSDRVRPLGDMQARVLRAHEALVDGDLAFVEHVLDDLCADLGRELVEQDSAHPDPATERDG